MTLFLKLCSLVHLYMVEFLAFHWLNLNSQILLHYITMRGDPWLSGRVLASGPVGPGIDTQPGHG